MYVNLMCQVGHVQVFIKTSVGSHKIYINPLVTSSNSLTRQVDT